MMNFFIREYLHFSKKERKGTILLIILIAICFIAPFFYSYIVKKDESDYSKFQKEVSALKIRQADSADKNYYSKNFDENNYTNFYEPSDKNYYTKTKGEVFYFDPNTASANDWKRLGIRDKTAETIQKYLSKGGHFYKPEDIAKIWGLHKDDVDRLLPYVRIEDNKKEYVYKNEFQNTNTPYKKPAPQIIDINTADTTAFISLPGIGSKLAQRIISFREKLGGFYSVEQIKETYGLPDSTFIKIKPQLSLNNPSVKKININTASLEEMKAHPYIRYNLANAIIQYRLQHGNYASAEDIKKIMMVTDMVYNKAAPYLVVN